MGPPQIIWVEPSARGSTMGTITDVDQKLLTQLRGIQDTAITLVTKGEFSMSHGDYRKAEAYFSVARERDPYNTNLQQDLIQLHQLELRAGGSGLFDAGTQGVTGTHFQPHRRLAVLPKSMLKEHENDPTVKELRLQEIAAYNGLAKADATLKLAQQGLGTGRSTQADVDRAQQAVDAAAQDFIRKQDKLKKRVHAVADNL
ncbi:MAG: hypothetical protein ISS15_15205 [Alphaproteobacteria bacterium]|nr:hypothetical protein [Alphaproteobacteria bacterium]MBL6937667.1 hypothetical protein [Alphaproteobacteria bacterium]MBL7099005.1 hypothetical protein [Alphaproteobacteria bacterium]